MQSIPSSLPENVRQVLGEFLDAAQNALGPDLQSVILYGSAAEGKLRATSDVNLAVILRTFAAEKIDQVRQPLRVAHAAIELSVMFILQSELAAAIEVFPDKFGDMQRRHTVLLGEDVLAGLSLSRSAQILRLRQALLNMVLRLRQRYVLSSLREEQAALAVAEASGPLRVCAANLLQLRDGTDASSPKEALFRVAQVMGGNWNEVLAQLSAVREQRYLPSGAAPPLLMKIIELAMQMHEQSRQLT